jgi:hypothetical protein
MGLSVAQRADHLGARKDVLMSTRWPSGDLREQWGELLRQSMEERTFEAISERQLVPENLWEVRPLLRRWRNCCGSSKQKEVGRPRMHLVNKEL